MSGAAATAEPRPRGGGLADVIGVASRYPEAGILVVAIVVAVVFQILNGAFLTSEVPVLLASTAQYGLLAVGEAMLMITAEIDLSAAKVYSTVPFLAYWAWSAGLVWPVAILLSLVGAGLIGALNGFITVRLGVPSLIATLGMLFLLNGMTLAVSHSQPVSTPAGAIDAALGSGQLHAGSLSGYAPFLWLLFAVFVLTVVLRRTRFGLHTISVGSNMLAAREIGIKTKKTKILNFVIMGVLAGFAGIVESCASGSIDPSAGDNTLTLYAIAAAVIGGTSLFGGSGTIVGALLGAFVVSSLNNGLPLVGAQAGFSDVPLGLAIIAAMILNIRLRALSLAKSRT